MVPLSVQRAGLVPYETGLALQAELVAARKAGTIGDTLVLLPTTGLPIAGPSSSGEPEVGAGPEVYPYHSRTESRGPWSTRDGDVVSDANSASTRASIGAAPKG